MTPPAAAGRPFFGESVLSLLLEGKRAFITGGTRGHRRGLVRGFFGAPEGADIRV